MKISQAVKLIEKGYSVKFKKEKIVPKKNISLKKDPYVGKQVISKVTNDIYFIIGKTRDGGYSVSNDRLMHKETLEYYYYVESKDF
jgi:hypothetical protein